MGDCTRQEMCRALDIKQGKLGVDIEQCSIFPIPGTEGRGIENRFLKTDLYHLALHFALQKNGMSREICAAMAKKHPLHGMTEKELSRVTYILYARKGKQGSVVVTDQHEIDFFNGNNEALVDEETAFTVLFVINFAKLYRIINRKIKALGL